MTMRKDAAQRRTTTESILGEGWIAVESYFPARQDDRSTEWKVNDIAVREARLQFGISGT